MKCVTTDAAKAIQKASSNKQEVYQDLYKELVGMEIPAIVAREYYYHESCRCILLKKHTEIKETQRNAFIKLKDYVHLNVIEKGKVVKMTQLVEIYKTFIIQKKK